MFVSANEYVFTGAVDIAAIQSSLETQVRLFIVFFGIVGRVRLLTWIIGLSVTEHRASNLHWLQLVH